MVEEDEILEKLKEMERYFLSRGIVLDRRDLVGRGNRKNSGLIMGEDGEIIGFDGKVFM